MTRKKNAFVKNKLKFNVCVLLLLFIFILSVIIYHTVIQREVSTPDEMAAFSTTLESIYKKLDPEEIKLISEDRSHTLSRTVPNKSYGRVIISGDSDGNIIILYDYQERYVLIDTFALAIFTTFAFSFLIICIVDDILKGIKKKKKNTSQKENKTETETETQTEIN